MGVNRKQADVLINQLSVLWVDDNAFVRKLVRGMLAHLGVKAIYEAADGIAALETMRAMTPDVVILDWEMPLLSGPELVRIALARRVADAEHSNHPPDRSRRALAYYPVHEARCERGAVQTGVGQGAV